MGGDYTRFTFDPVKGFSGVLKQQGRVSLDSDANELEELCRSSLRRLALRERVCEQRLGDLVADAKRRVQRRNMSGNMPVFDEGHLCGERENLVQNQRSGVIVTGFAGMR